MTNIEKLIERMGWQPIEEAKKTDERILAKNSDGVIASVYWSDSVFYKGWVLWQMRSDYDDFYPTHFMPIPTGKEGEIVRVLWKALQEIWIKHGGQKTEKQWREDINFMEHTARKALAKAEELAGDKL